MSGISEQVFGHLLNDWFFERRQCVRHDAAPRVPVEKNDAFIQRIFEGRPEQAVCRESTAKRSGGGSDIGILPAERLWAAVVDGGGVECAG